LGGENRKAPSLSSPWVQDINNNVIIIIILFVILFIHYYYRVAVDGQIYSELGDDIADGDKQWMAMACYLLRHGADLHQTNHQGMTPLDLIASPYSTVPVTSRHVMTRYLATAQEKSRCVT